MGTGRFYKPMNTPIRVAVLDDYQNVALRMADWSAVTARAEVTVFDDHLADEDALVTRLAPFDAVFVMRERTPLPRRVLARLPRLGLIASTGNANASIDMAAAAELGIHVSHTGGSGRGWPGSGPPSAWMWWRGART